MEQRYYESIWSKQDIQLYDGSWKPATGYESAVSIWVDTHEDGSYDKFKVDQEGCPVMPDYNLL